MARDFRQYPPGRLVVDARSVPKKASEKPQSALIAALSSGIGIMTVSCPEGQVIVRSAVVEVGPDARKAFADAGILFPGTIPPPEEEEG